jgi:hypothetical protein
MGLMRRQMSEMAGVLSIIAMVGAMGACTDGSVPPASPGGQQTMPPTGVTTPSTTRGYLEAPRTFAVAATSTAAVTAWRDYDTPSTDETANLQIKTGSLTLQAQADGMLAVRTLDIELGTIHLDSARVPDLTGVKLSLRQEADVRADWASDDSAMNAAASADLLLDWSMVTESGAVVPLATQKIDQVPFEIIVSHRSGGGYSVDFHATRSGTFWTYAGLIRLADLHVDLEATP